MGERRSAILTRSRVPKTDNQPISECTNNGSVSDLLNATLRESDELFADASDTTVVNLTTSFGISSSDSTCDVSIIPETQALSRKSISHLDIRNYAQVIDENESLRAQVESLQAENLDMQNFLFRKEQELVRSDNEKVELRRQVAALCDEVEKLKREEANLMRTVGVLSDDLNKQPGTTPQPKQSTSQPTNQAQDLESRVSKLEGLIHRLMEKSEKRPNLPQGTGKQNENERNGKVQEAGSRRKTEKKVDLKLMGDSMLKPVRLKLGKDVLVKKEAIGGANLKKIRQKVESEVQSVSESVLIHCGTNDIKLENGRVKNMKEIESDIRGLFKSVGKIYKGKKVIISGIIYRERVDPRDICKINDLFAMLCETNKFIFVDPNAWVGYDGLCKDGLHLNKKGSTRLSGLYGRIYNSLKNKKNL